MASGESLIAVRKLYMTTEICNKYVTDIFRFHRNHTGLQWNEAPGQAAESFKSLEEEDM